MPDQFYTQKHMTEEDRTAEKLKGHNWMIKFLDGEELYLKVDGNDDDQHDWAMSAGEFMAGESTFPSSDFIPNRDHVKYIIKL